MLRGVAKHRRSPNLAEAVIKDGGLSVLVDCLEEFDPSVKEAGAWALACIARSTPNLDRKIGTTPSLPSRWSPQRQ